MTESRSSSFIRGIIIGLVLSSLYVLYRFFRPYYYAIRLRHWLQVERDYIEEYSRTIHPLGYYEYEIRLTGQSAPVIEIGNKGRRVPVIIRTHYEFDPGVLGTLLERSSEERELLYDEQLQFFQQVQWFLNDAPGVYNFIDADGGRCSPDESRGFVIDYRIYPDSVSQHKIINSIVEIGNAIKSIQRFEDDYRDRINQQS